MKLFSPGGAGLSAVAKPRLGDTDQRACELLPTMTIKPPPSRRFRSMDEFRHRSFAQVCRAEANVSLSAPRRIKRPRRVGFGQRKIEGRLDRGVAGREVERVWHDAWNIAYEPSSTLSDRSFSPFRQSLRTLVYSPSRKKQLRAKFWQLLQSALYIHTVCRVTRRSSRLRLRASQDALSCVCV